MLASIRLAISRGPLDAMQLSHADVRVEAAHGAVEHRVLDDLVVGLPQIGDPSIRLLLVDGILMFVLGNQLEAEAMAQVAKLLGGAEHLERKIVADHPDTVKRSLERLPMQVDAEFRGAPATGGRTPCRA